jgi:hypothetical protein
MELRPDLMPPVLDAARVARLAELAARLDGARPGQWEDDLAEFNRLAGSATSIEELQGIYGAEDHEDWVRRLLYNQSLIPTELSPDEMVEIVSRAMPQNGNPDYDFYLEVFLVNCRHPAGSDLIFWPNLVPELPQDREPTAEEIADLALGRPAEEVRGHTASHQG